VFWLMGLGTTHEAIAGGPSMLEGSPPGGAIESLLGCLVKPKTDTGGGFSSRCRKLILPQKECCWRHLIVMVLGRLKGRSLAGDFATQGRYAVGC